jgi:ABC-type branched-subunit amino acid transport system ATPase component/ABC-type branched-subunit amino acid transport system permease subunit
VSALSRALREAFTRRRLIIAGSLILGAFLLLNVVLPQLGSSRTASGKWESPLPVVVLGTIIGLTYGLLSVGLVLIYRTNRLINFAHGQIGAFGAAVFAVAVTRWHIPYWIAIVPALLVAAGTGAIGEVAVVRRLRKAPAIMSVVATLGLGQFLVLFSAAINSQASALAPQPPFLPEFTIGALLVTRAYSGMLLLSPLVVVAIGAFLKFSRVGLAIRGSADNQEAALMAGVFAPRMSSLAWGLAGALAAFSAILTLPTQPWITGDSFGPHLLLIALTGAVLARMQSLPIALLAGTVIGITEQLLLRNYGQAGLVELVLFFIILASLLLQRQRVGRGEAKGSWAAVQPPPPLPLAIRRVRTVRLLFPTLAGLLLVALAVLPLAITNANSVKMTGIFGFVIVGLSVGVITGLGGQLSLGQFAIAAVGAIASFQIARRTGNYVEAFFYAGLAGAVVSVLVGLPALRIRGLLLTVTTLSFALVLPNYLLHQEFLLGTGRDPGRPILMGNALDSGDSYYYVGLVAVLIAFVLARNIRTSGIGRRLVAVRDNEDAARAFSVSATAVKLQGFALAGFLAGLGGAMYGHALSLISASTFTTNASIDVVKMAVIGGIGLLSGPIIGAVFVFGVSFVPLDTAGLAATALGQLLIIMYLPGGLGALVTPLRDRVANALARRAGVDVAAVYAAERGFSDYRTEGAVAPALAKAKRRERAARGPLLEARGIAKSFGGVRAVRGVSFEVQVGETLGLIGPNGAGKTTTFELLAGFTKLDRGRVLFRGDDVTGLTPEALGRLGLIRSFQDAALFPTLTVLECVQLALERTQPTRLLPSLLGLRGREKRKLQRAEELISWMGLQRYRSSQVQELSTGTRRIAEIACLVALEPQLLLLDEPSSGVAQKETEALGALLRRLKAELGLTLVIIEHDIPMIMALSDRIVCMADGEVISVGAPEHVRNDPGVVEAYLGGSITAIERSSAAPSKQPPAPERSLADVVPGLGRTREAALLDAFGSVDAVLSAPTEELQKVRGIGPGMAARIASGLASGRTS